MRKTAGDQTVDKLIDEGWTVSHTATVRRYMPAGTVSPMCSKDGNDYCRVHHGQTVGRHTYQITTVMRRPSKA